MKINSWDVQTSDPFEKVKCPLLVQNYILYLVLFLNKDNCLISIKLLSWGLKLTFVSISGRNPTNKSHLENLLILWRFATLGIGPLHYFPFPICIQTNQTSLQQNINFFLSYYHGIDYLISQFILYQKETYISKFVHIIKDM